MIVRFIMDTKLYTNVMKAASKVAEYMAGMYNEPKYIALRLLFTAIVPDFSIVLFAVLSRMHVMM